jgi:hypothetical protein
MSKGKHLKGGRSKASVHTSRKLRGLVRGKTKSSKIRNEGRSARSLARSRNTSTAYRARSR